MSFVMSLDPQTLAKLIMKAFEKEIEDRIWQKWLAEFPHMDEKSFISFEQYKDKHFKPHAMTDKTDEEILKDAENILKIASNSKT